MSEPSSFFLKVSITQAQFDRFMQSAPTPPHLDANWQGWWDSREMYGKKALTETDIGCYDIGTNQEIVNLWLGGEEAYAFSSFDGIREVWEFGIVMCTENYTELLPLLAFVLSIAPYKKHSPDDFAVVYPFFWGDSGVMAYIGFEPQAGLIPEISSTEQVPAAHLQHAESCLEQHWMVFQENMECD